MSSTPGRGNDGMFTHRHRVQTGFGAHSAFYPKNTGVISPGVKRPGREAYPSRPSSVEVNNAWSYTFTPQYVFMAWCLVKHTDRFTSLEGIARTQQTGVIRK
jgi:hypothetical protein